MIGNALLGATVVCVAIVFWLMQLCSFLIPYRVVLFHAYASTLGAWAAVTFLNVFAGFYVLGRTLFLKDTGQKLAHLEKQLRSGASISDELARRLED